MATLQKIQIVNQALRRAGLSSTATLMVADQQSVTDGLFDLEALMAEQIRDGLDFPYIFTTNSDGVPDGNEDSGLDLWTLEALALKLGQRMLIDNQRDLPPDVRALLKEKWDDIKIQFYKVPPLKRRNDMPTGAGNQSTWAHSRFYDDDSAK
ncbi:TPA: packaged DNA stabilization protein p27 [Enterobacter kobei]|nr:packaged DNA stabilization protein p27 [Enterobacter kobei]